MTDEHDVAAGFGLEPRGPVAEAARRRRRTCARCPVGRSRVRTVAMVWPTSPPYAPTFWIGVAPTRPGMPDRASSPLHSSVDGVADQRVPVSPAATVTTAPEHAATSAAIPRVATLTTVPAKPSSPTSRFEPPPRTSTGSPAASSVARRVDDQLGLGLAVTNRRAGPPTRRVVWSASRRPAGRSSGHVVTHQVTEVDFGPGRAEHLLRRRRSPRWRRCPVAVDRRRPCR